VWSDRGVPEGHTLHRLARSLNEDLAGEPLAASSPQGRFEGSAERIDGRVLDRAEAYGKHLFAWWGEDVVHVHLGLYGTLRRQASPPAPPVGQVRLRLTGDRWSYDLRGPTRCALVTPADRDAVLARLGPDPLHRRADPERMWRRLSRSRAPVGTAMLDQSVVAGVGNVFRAELLFLVGVHPTRPSRDVNRVTFEALWAVTVAQLRRALRSGRIVTVDPREVGRPLSRIRAEEGRYVYKQDVCRRCGTPVQRWLLGARTAYACPTCQPS
jgi:endonuclease VIII